MQIEIALKNVHFKHVDFPIYNKLLCKQDIISIKIYILFKHMEKILAKWIVAEFELRGRQAGCRICVFFCLAVRS